MVLLGNGGSIPASENDGGSVVVCVYVCVRDVSKAQRRVKHIARAWAYGWIPVVAAPICNKDRPEGSSLVRNKGQWVNSTPLALRQPVRLTLSLPRISALHLLRLVARPLVRRAPPRHRRGILLMFRPDAGRLVRETLPQPRLRWVLWSCGAARRRDTVS